MTRNFTTRRLGWLLVLAGSAGSLAWLAAQQTQAPTAPVQTSAQSPNGKQLFEQSGCIYCHGVAAAGTEKAPSLLAVGTRLSRAQIEHQIRAGGMAMPAFGEALEPADIQTLVDYLATQRAAPTAKAEHPKQKEQR